MSTIARFGKLEHESTELTGREDWRPPELQGEYAMFNRYRLGALGLVSLFFSITGCVNTQVGSISITPATPSVATGQTVQLTATGTVGHGSHPASSQNV